jgi:hypothetical protein
MLTKAIPYHSHKILKENATTAVFIRDKEYDCVVKQNGNYVIKEESGSAIELEPMWVELYFKIKF